MESHHGLHPRFTGTEGLFWLMLAALMMSAGATQAQSFVPSDWTLIAHYPLTVSVDDTTGNNGALETPRVSQKWRSSLHIGRALSRPSGGTSITCRSWLPSRSSSMPAAGRSVLPAVRASGKTQPRTHTERVPLLHGCRHGAILPEWPVVERWSVVRTRLCAEASTRRGICRAYPRRACLADPKDVDASVPDALTVEIAEYDVVARIRHSSTILRAWRRGDGERGDEKACSQDLHGRWQPA